MVNVTPQIKSAIAAPLRAAWAPLLVFGLHLFISRVLNAYLLIPPLDIPMHFFGGVSIAYFFARSARALPVGTISPAFRPWLVAVLVFALTGTATVFWEFAEFFSDHLFATHAQLGLGDTLLDMALGVGGGVTYLAMAAKSCLLGVAAPSVADASAP